jgi:hypothetical protein
LGLCSSRRFVRLTCTASSNGCNIVDTGDPRLPMSGRWNGFAGRPEHPQNPRRARDRLNDNAAILALKSCRREELLQCKRRPHTFFALQYCPTKRGAHGCRSFYRWLIGGILTLNDFTLSLPHIGDYAVCQSASWHIV